MNILYVGTQPAEVQALATAVNALGERVRVFWASDLDRVAKWIDENHGLRVLVVEAQPNGAVWRSVLTYTAGLRTALPVVVIVPEETTSDLPPLALEGHECVTRNPSLLRNLPAVITRAIDQAREHQTSQQKLENLGELERLRADLEVKLAQATAAIQEAEHRHQFAMAAAAEQLARTRSQYETGLARAAATRDMVDEQFREAAKEVERARVRQASAVAEAERLARREAELSVLLDTATATRGVLERRLADAEAALRAAEDRAAEEQRTVAELSAERQREFERKISEEIDKRRGVEEMLAHAVSAGNVAEQRFVWSMKGAAAESREQRAALSVAQQERDSQAARLEALATREAQLEEQIRQERAAGAALGKEKADAHTALEEQQQRHQAALAAAAAELAERQANFERERAEGEAERSALTAQLREVEEARDQARREHQSVVADVARLSEREAQLDALLNEERATRGALEQAVADAAAALRDEQQRHDVALTAAVADLAERQAHFDRERAHAEAERADLTAQVRAVEDARDQARREHQSVVADLTRLTERAAAEREGAASCQADLEARLSHANETIEGLKQTLAEIRANALDTERLLTEEINALRADARVQTDQFNGQRLEYESRLAEERDVNSRLTGERLALQESLHSTQEESDRRDQEHRAQNERLEQAHTVARATIQQLTAERQEIERQWEEAQSGFRDSLDRLTRDHAATLAARENDIEQLRISLAARIEELEVIKGQREALQAEADQLPGLQKELQQSRTDNHRLFQQAPLPMFRCTKDGVLTQANRMFMVLVGRRSPDELRGADFAAAVFEAPNDLSWLIERCLGSRGKESTETTWRGKDGSRLLVRLSACATSSDLIECGVEDLTRIRVLHDRLSQAHRMEAVGRLAIEVAVTCGNLLRGIQQDAQVWLMTEGSHTASRQRGEMLLQEMSRAAGLLRQLAAYGDEENRKPAVVELSTIIRDMAPVLKRVAGDAVEVQLTDASAPLNVDAGAERVERLLVNLAAYGRERMPLGGRLKIELATVVVDRHFAAKHPNVRLGPHALITVTESRSATRADGLLQLRDDDPARKSVAVQPMVDLGTLQELVGECGGHLWMTVEPLGDMVVKIRLPLVTSYGEPSRRTAGPGGMRTLTHWFQH